MTQLSRERTLQFLGAVLLITVRSQYAVRNGTCLRSCKIGTRGSGVSIEIISLLDTALIHGGSACLFLRQTRVHDAMLLPEMLIVHFCPIVQDFKRKSIIIVPPYTLDFLTAHDYL